ncbi:MAG TPA: phosphotransferase [Solirubrobacteraceae bacterium]|nr:phosphotransferase [Solirubrobacteraceae bacterium]
MRDAPLIRTPDELTSDWLSEALGRPGLELRGTERIGTGQMSQSHRVRFRAGAGSRDESVVVKLASENETSRATGVGLGAYSREISFYRQLADRIAGPLPRCFLASYDATDGWFTLVLEDIVDGVQGDQIAGCSVAEAEVALRALAQIHAPVLGDVALGTADYLNLPNPLNQAVVTALLPQFLERYGSRVAGDHADLLRAFVPSLDALGADRRPPLGLVHGDYRLDNLLFGARGCTVVDWQTMAWGPAMLDATYFVGGGLTVEDRRVHEERLIRAYYDELGAESFSWERCWEEYRRQVFYGLVMAICASMIVQRTERGDEMFMALLARHAQQALDLDSLSLLPAAGSGRPVALQPEAADEGRHPPGGEALWNESWYFDAVSDALDLGVYVRLGRLPNRDVALYTACVCGPGRPSIMLVDPEAPLPGADDDAQVVSMPGLEASQVCEEPLRRWRVRLEGIAQVFDDQSAPLRGESGEPIDISLDLVWETDGVPYAWRQSTRYEIPCRVTGVVTVGEERIAFAGPGQRDHSWSARDWWAVDWVWSGLHFEDGTHTHAVGIPAMPGYGVGYVQRDGVVDEIESVTTSAEVAADGLIERATITSGPDTLALDVEPLAFGALRLEAPDGRLSLFPRAMCRVRAGDGRAGVGWVEWNRVQRGG